MYASSTGAGRLPLGLAVCVFGLLVAVAFGPGDEVRAQTASGDSSSAGDVMPTGETGRYTDRGYPIVDLPPGADSTDEDWRGVDLTPKPPVEPKSPDQQIHHLIPPQGYDLVPVLWEPAIKQPGQIAFDGNGRMFVLELRSYMLDADATDELAPISRISRHTDTDGDGIYDENTVFVDSLVFPRFVMPFGKGAVLTMESNADNVYRYVDTDGDGRADERELFTTDFGKSGNVEHQQASLHWGMDNWMYATYHSFRIRWTPDGVIREETGANRSQWGITHDSDGKMWFQDGASGVPGYFQFPIHYGNIEVENELVEGFRVPYGAPIKLADFQGGMDQVRMPDGSLNSVTGAAGAEIFRGHRLPDELVGQYFYGEPVARIVRRIDPVVTEGLTRLHNAYQDERSEFLRAIDPLFRPVDVATAPDGTMYVVDMYHGIIQEAQWAQPGDYLRAKIEQYQLDEVVGLGRIFRLTHESRSRDSTRPRMLDESAAQLVDHLDHPNGWWRDKAQQLLVLRQDTSVVPALEEMARSSDDLLGRFHALWTLEGLGVLETDLVGELMADPHPRLRIQALRAWETLYKNGEKELSENVLGMMLREDTDVVIQAMLTASVLGIPGWTATAERAVATNDARGVRVVGSQLLEEAAESESGAFDEEEYTAAQIELLERGSEIYDELCAQCHGVDGTGTPAGRGATLAPSLVGSPRVQAHPEYVIKTLLHGLRGPVDGETYAGGTMVGMDEQTDRWIAAAASFVRTQFANDASPVSPTEVERVRARTSERVDPYTFETLKASIPRPLESVDDWSARASHSAPTRIGGTGEPEGAFSHEGWTTGVPQEPGMWFEIELPATVPLTEIRFESDPEYREVGQEGGEDEEDEYVRFETAPKGYLVEVSIDGESWRQVGEGSGAGDELTIGFPTTRARHVRITQTEDVDEEVPWRMRELELFVRGSESGVSG